MSSLSRAFTTRRVKMSIDMADASKGHQPKRSQSTRENGNPVLRHKISAPMQLVHTTNMLSYNAPDLPRPSRSNSSLKSEAESETPSTTESTPPTSPDVTPEECGPIPNHLSTYFMAPGKAYVGTHVEPAPAIPQRSPSHTKKNSYDAIARQRSTSRLSKESERSVSSKGSFTFSRSSSTSTRASSVSHVSTPQKQAAPPMPSPPAPPASYQQHNLKESHPFGQELAQVTELAEEYGAQPLTKIDQEDFDYIESHGLVRHAAEDYLSDVQSLVTSFFNDKVHARPTAMWI